MIVNPEALRNYGYQLRRALDDAHDCRTYANARIPDIEPGIEGRLINPVSYAHVAVRRELGALLDRLIDILEESQKAIFDAAVHYERTDAESAQRLDQSYPAVQRPVPAAS